MKFFKLFLLISLAIFSNSCMSRQHLKNVETLNHGGMGYTLPKGHNEKQRKTLLYNMSIDKITKNPTAVDSVKGYRFLFVNDRSYSVRFVVMSMVRGVEDYSITLAKKGKDVDGDGVKEDHFFEFFLPGDYIIQAFDEKGRLMPFRDCYGRKIPFWKLNISKRIKKCLLRKVEGPLHGYVFK